MTRTLFAAMSGVAFGLVLGVSGHQFYTRMCCPHSPARQVVRAEKPPAQPCAATASRTVPSPPIADVQKDAPTSSVDVDAQADQSLAQARSLASKDPNRARELCRTTMLLYNNNPSNARVRAAFKLLNSIKMREDEDF